MAVTINASIDGTSYNNITKIAVGGKNINLSGIADGSDLPEQVAEIKYGSYSQESDGYSSKDFEHGCSGTPDIIIVWSDFKTRYTSESKPAQTTIVGATWNFPGAQKAYTTVGTSYSGGTSNPNNPYAGGLASTDDGYIQTVDSTKFTIKFTNTRRLGGGLTYSWLAIRLAM